MPAVSRSVKNEADAWDLSQEVFVKVYRRLGDLDNPERFVSWMLSIARNAAIDHQRRLKARPPAQDIPVEDMTTLAGAALDPHDIAEGNSNRQLIHRALSRIGSIHREIILLHEIQGLALEEIAGMLGVPLGTVKSRTTRARHELAKAVVAEEGAMGA